MGEYGRRKEGEAVRRAVYSFFFLAAEYSCSGRWARWFSGGWCRFLGVEFVGLALGVCYFAVFEHYACFAGEVIPFSV